MEQMGGLYFEQNQFEAALKHFIQAYLVFEKLGSPLAAKVKENIALCRDKLPEAQFKSILKEFNLEHPGDLEPPEPGK